FGGPQPAMRIHEPMEGEPGGTADPGIGWHRCSNLPAWGAACMNDAAPSRHGSLKIFLGYAAGVGKTYKMLEESQQLKRVGHDIVVGYFESQGRKDTIARAEGLEIIPRRRVEYRGHAFEEMDTDAILKRHPEICAVDEFPHTNVPGVERTKRWEDAMVLLADGIDVLTT